MSGKAAGAISAPTGWLCCFKTAGTTDIIARDLTSARRPMFTLRLMYRFFQPVIHLKLAFW